MKRTYFAPDNFEVTAERVKWAMTTFRIAETEVHRQTELWHEHEYKRAYFDWNRAWKRWFRQAEKFNTLEREREYRRPDKLSKEQRQQDIEAFERDMKRLRVVK